MGKKKKRKKKRYVKKMDYGAMGDWEKEAMSGQGLLGSVPKGSGIMGLLGKGKDPRQELRELRQHEQMERVRGKIAKLKAARDRRTAEKRRQQIEQLKTGYKSVKKGYASAKKGVRAVTGFLGKFKKKKRIYD